MRAKHDTRSTDPAASRERADEEAWARVLDAARGPAGAVARRIVRNWHTAEDVVQEALLRAVVAQDQLPDIANLEAWFCGVVRNLAVDRVRREVREREIIEALSAVEPGPDVSTPGHAEAREQAELQELIREAMRQLSESNRRVVDLFYLRHQSLRQVADGLGVSPNTVKQRLFRARDLLRHALAALSLDAYSLAKHPRRKARPLKTAPVVRPRHPLPPGWNAFGTTEFYDLRLDPACRLTGTGSATIAASGEAADMSAGLLQRFPAGPWRGRRLLARLHVKGENLEDEGFYAFLEAHDRNNVGYNVVWPRCGGTFAWQALETVIDVPDTDGLLTIGFQLLGGGQVWVDRVELQDAPNATPPSDVRHSITWPGLTNLDFSDTASAWPATRRMPGLAPGWFGVNVNPETEPEVVALDRSDYLTGAASARLDHRGLASPRLHRIHQRVPCDHAWQGRHLRMRGWAKCVDAERAGLWLRTDAGDQARSLDDLHDRPLTGTRDWAPYELVAAITPETTHIAFGSLLHGRGALWLDRVEFEGVDSAVPCTGSPVSETRWQPRPAHANETPRNLDFSEPLG